MISMIDTSIFMSRRSIRRFQQKRVSLNLLKKCVDAARLAPSAANLQPLEFIIVTNKMVCGRVFEALHWAAYLKPEWRPMISERPVAYIIILVKDKTSPWYLRDVSFAAGTIVHIAETMGVGSCILCKIDKEIIREILSIPQSLLVDSVIALGYKAEHPVIEEASSSVEYYRDSNGVLHVPKRKLEDILHINTY